MPTAPDSGALGARPTTFRGGLCQHWAPPPGPAPRHCPGQFWGGGWGARGAGQGTGEPGLISAARVPTHRVAPLTSACGGMGVLLATQGTLGRHPSPQCPAAPLSFMWREPPIVQMGKLRLWPPPKAGQPPTPGSPVRPSSFTCSLVPSRNRGASWLPAPCHASGVGFTQGCWGKPRGQRGFLGDTGAEPERLREGDLEEGTAGARAGCGLGDQSCSLVCTEGPGEPWHRPWSRPPCLELGPLVCPPPQPPVSFQAFVLAVPSSRVTLPLALPGSLLLILRPSAWVPPPPGSLPSPQGRPGPLPVL